MEPLGRVRLRLESKGAWLHFLGDITVSPHVCQLNSFPSFVSQTQKVFVSDQGVAVSLVRHFVPQFPKLQNGVVARIKSDNVHQVSRDSR